MIARENRRWFGWWSYVWRGYLDLGGGCSSLESQRVSHSLYSSRHWTSTSTTKISPRDQGKAPANAFGSKSSLAFVQLIDEDKEEEHEEEEEEEEKEDDSRHVHQKIVNKWYFYWYQRIWI